MINIALVGYGYWGPNVARNLYKNHKLNFTYICDKKEERLQAAKVLYANDVKYTTNYSEILNDREIDAVALAVETSAHYELAKEALLAGKHIYVEKPFTDSSKEAIELKELAESKNLKVHVDHIMVFHPAIRKIKELISNKSIGKILYFDCSRVNLGNIKNDVSAMWDLSVHDLSVIDYLTDGAAVHEVQAMGEKAYSKKESITFLNIYYDGFIANLKASWLSPIKERKMIIAGTERMIVYDDVDVLNKLIVYDKGFDIEPNTNYDEYVVKSRSGDAMIPRLEVEDALFNSLEHFRLCIEQGKESITNADAAIRVINILELADKKLIVEDN